jgi:hypothetical protein
MTAVEYVAGLELLRPFIIYLLLSKEESENVKEKIKRTCRLWLPYLIPFLLFLIYRVFIASSVLYKFQQMEAIKTNPLVTLISMIAQQFKNVYSSTIPVWEQVIRPFLDFNFSTIFCKLYMVLFVLFFAGMLFVTAKLKPDEPRRKKWLIPLAIGLLYPCWRRAALLGCQPEPQRQLPQ